MLLVLLVPSFLTIRSASSDSGGPVKQEAWNSLWEGDGVSPPDSEGWWVRHWGTVSVTTGVSDGATVATIDDSDAGEGGWMQRFINFTPPFQIATRGRYDPTGMHGTDDVKTSNVFIGSHRFAAVYLPDRIQIDSVPSITIPITQGSWHNITFDARAPLDVDIYLDGVFVQNVEMVYANSIIWDQEPCKPAITAIETTIQGRVLGMVDYIRTTLPSLEEGPVKVCERIPPLVVPTLDDGVQTPSSDLTVGFGTRVWLNATIDDTTTGNENIWSANYTLGQSNWPGIKMTPVDGAFDSPREDVTAEVDTGTLPLGDYTYCVYGRDYLGNWNRTGACVILHVVSMPNSQVDPIVPYWWNHPVDVTATAVEVALPLSNVSLYYRRSPDNTTWEPWTLWGVCETAPWNWTFSFPAGEGYYIFYSIAEDIGGNKEPPPSMPDALAAYDITPPLTSIVVGEPKYQAAELYVKSSTGISLSAGDRGVARVGLGKTEYRIEGGVWRTYAPYITLSGADGPRTVGYRSSDLLGNTEAARSLRVVVDNTPPVTELTPSSGEFTTETRFNLSATDAGCGVRRTEYRIDGGEWRTYGGWFTLSRGSHNVSFRSTDNLDNMEPPKYRQVTIPDQSETNYKPLVAAVFAIVLVSVGLWSSQRRPWGGDRKGPAVIEAFAYTTLPFVAAEIVTGVLSLFIKELTIPPILGLGTAADVGILVIGLIVLVYRAMEKPAGEPMQGASAKN